MSKNDGGQAFPDETNYGLSIRDWFAGMALIAVAIDHVGIDLALRDDAQGTVYEMAYRAADAMIAERGKDDD